MLDQIEKDLQAAISRAEYCSKLPSINRTVAFEDLWKTHNIVITELHKEDNDFFKSLVPLTFPKPRTMKRFMKEQYYGQFFGE